MGYETYLMSQLVFKFPFKTKYFEQDFYVAANNFSAYKLVELKNEVSLKQTVSSKEKLASGT